MVLALAAPFVIPLDHDILISLNSDPDFDQDNPVIVVSQSTSLLSYKHIKLAAASLPILVSPAMDSYKKMLTWNYDNPSLLVSTCTGLNSYVPACRLSNDSLHSSAPFVPAKIYANLFYDPDFDRNNPTMATSAASDDSSGLNSSGPVFSFLSLPFGHPGMLVSPSVPTTLVAFNDD